MPHLPHYNLRSFIKALKDENEFHVIDTVVDPHLEIAEIHRRVVAQKGKALLFSHVKGSNFPVVTNLFGSEKRLELAFPDRPEKLIQQAIDLLTGPLPPSLATLWKERSLFKRLASLGTRKRKWGPVAECEIAPCDLNKLPILTCWPEDGGPFITLPLVYTEGTNPKKPSNIGMYRIQRFSQSETGLHFQIGKGAGFHLREAEAKNAALPVSIFLGGAPALMLAAIAPLPENVPEILFASLLQGKKLDVIARGHPHPLFAECEFAIQGFASPGKRRLEGPFGDHYGYYGLAHEYPVLEVSHMYHRKDAIYPATVVGKPIQEDLYIGNYLQKLLSPMIPVVMPSVIELWSYPEAGFHPLAAARIQERYEKEALATAFRIFGEGQLSLTKVLMITDAAVDLTDCRALFEAVLSRCSFDKDFYIFCNTANDTLDYTGPRLNMGSKALFIGTGSKKRDLPSTFAKTPPSIVANVCIFCKGVVAIDGAIELSDIASILAHEAFTDWPLVILVDDAKQATHSPLEFLWTLFTRFEPQSDIYPLREKLSRHHISYDLPLLIDARQKKHYPPEALSDPHTHNLVNRRWHEYAIDS